jgi:hypothetical protein
VPRIRPPGVGRPPDRIPGSARAAAKGDLRPDGNGGPPDDGGSNRGGLPDFPPDWWPVIIPDDASELDEEAQALRRELLRHARQSTVRSALGLREKSRARHDSPLGAPAVIMAVAVLTTLISLFVVVWGQQPDSPGPSTSPPGVGPVPASTAVSRTSAAGLVDTVLNDAANQPVRLGSLLPAVVLLVDQCDCAALVPALAEAAPPGVTIVPVAMSVTETEVKNIHALADPKNVLRAMLTDPAHPVAPAAVAVLLDSRGTVALIKTDVRKVEEIVADVVKLAV